MKVIDINEHLKPPKHHELRFVNATGAFVRLEYRATLISANDPLGYARSTVVIYLNDMGREVLRTEDLEPIKESPLMPPQKQSFWTRLYLMYIGVVRCIRHF